MTIRIDRSPLLGNSILMQVLTVNVPNEFTVEEVEELICMHGKDLKGINIYRDGC